MENNMENVTGKFTPKKKFLGFVSALKSGFRVNSDVGIISGKQLSGMLEDNTFEMKIYQDGTIDLIEVDGKVDDGTLSRLVDQICEMDTTGYTGKCVVYGLDFTPKEEMDGAIKINKKSVFYLEVDHKKPIDVFLSIVNEDLESNKKPSDKALSILNGLFGDADDADDLSTPLYAPPLVLDEAPEISVSRSYAEESFLKMNENKILELKERVEKSKNEIKKVEFEKSSAESRLKTIKEEFGILNTRLDNMTPPNDPNGWVFHVSEENKKGIEIDEKTKEVVDKISPLLNLIPDRVIKFLTEGYFTIKIGDKSSISKEPKEPTDGVVEDLEDKFKLPTDVLQKIFGIDPLGRISYVSELEYEYRGELNWHQIVSKMIKSGFEQSPEFDKLSGSNSYNKKENTKNMSNIKIEKFENFDPLLDKLDDIESGFGEDDYQPSDLIFAVYGTTNRDGEKKTALYVVPKKSFEETGDLDDTFCQDDLIPGMDCIQECVYILGALGDESHDYKDLVKRALDVGIKPNKTFQNFVSNQAKTDNTWCFFDSHEMDDILDELGYDSSKSNKIYFMLDADGHEEEGWDWNGDAKISIYITLDKNDFDASEPRWENISPIIKKIGLVPNEDGYCMECCVDFDRDDQSENIKNMEWSEVRQYVIDKLTSEGWSLV